MDHKDHIYWAKVLLKTLICRVINFNDGDDIFIAYSVLAKQVNYPRPHIGSLFGMNIGRTLGKMGHLLDDIVVDGIQPPLIQAMVVAKATQLPSYGLGAYKGVYPSLSKEKKRNFISLEYQKIFDYGERWLDVLKQLEIEINTSDNKPNNHTIPTKKKC